MRDLVIFIPSIEGGGVEKNLFSIIKFFKTKFENIFLITGDKLSKNFFGNNVKLITPKSKFYNNKPRVLKSLICYTYNKRFNTICLFFILVHYLEYISNVLLKIVYI